MRGIQKASLFAKISTLREWLGNILSAKSYVGNVTTELLRDEVNNRFIPGRQANPGPAARAVADPDRPGRDAGQQPGAEGCGPTRRPLNHR